MTHSFANLHMARWCAALVDWWEGRWFRRSAIALVAGMLLSRAFAPVGWWPVVFIAFPIAVLLIDRAAGWRDAFGRGWWFGFGFFAAGLNWIAVSFSQQSNVPAALAPFAIMALAAGMALYCGGSFALARAVWSKTPWRGLVFAASWTLFEGLRAVVLTGFPWNLVGTLWADSLWAAQGAWLVSTYGLSLLTVWLGASLVTVGDADLSAKHLAPFGMAFMLFTAMTAWGGARLQQNPPEFRTDIVLRLIQANVKQREKWVPSLIEDHFDNHLDLSRGNTADGRAKGVDLLIWPEATVQRTSFDRDGSIHRWRLSRVLEPGGLALVGGPRYADGPADAPEDYKLYNSAFAVNADGDILARYDKQHLVPFGEYLPFQGLLRAIGVEQLTGGRGFSSGQSAEALRIGDIPPFRVLICYEAIFPGAVMDDVGAAEWLLNITNDGWFGLSEGPHQHFAQARMRAVEEGVPLVRSAGGGISAIIGPAGRVFQTLGLNRRGAVNGHLPRPIEGRGDHYSTETRFSFIFIISILIVFSALLYRKTFLKTD